MAEAPWGLSSRVDVPRGGKKRGRDDEDNTKVVPDDVEDVCVSKKAALKLARAAAKRLFEFEANVAACGPDVSASVAALSQVSRLFCSIVDRFVKEGAVAALTEGVVPCLSSEELGNVCTGSLWNVAAHFAMAKLFGDSKKSEAADLANPPPDLDDPTALVLKHCNSAAFDAPLDGAACKFIAGLGAELPVAAGWVPKYLINQLQHTPSKAEEGTFRSVCDVVRSMINAPKQAPSSYREVLDRTFVIALSTDHVTFVLSAVVQLMKTPVPSLHSDASLLHAELLMVRHGLTVLLRTFDLSNSRTAIGPTTADDVLVMSQLVTDCMAVMTGLCAVARSNLSKVGHLIPPLFSLFTKCLLSGLRCGALREQHMDAFSKMMHSVASPALLQTCPLLATSIASSVIATASASMDMVAAHAAAFELSCMPVLRAALSEAERCLVTQGTEDAKSLMRHSLYKAQEAHLLDDGADDEESAAHTK